MDLLKSNLLSLSILPTVLIALTSCEQDRLTPIPKTRI